MTAPVEILDLVRMRRARIEKLRAAMEAAAVDVLVLCGQNNVSYATGARVPAADHVRAGWWRNVAVFERKAQWPVVYTAYPDGVPSEIHTRPWIAVERDDAVDFAAHLPAGSLAIDDAPFPLWSAIANRGPVDASMVMGPAKLTKTPDELECIRQAQSINERAMREVRGAAIPGARATDLSNLFQQLIIEDGATSNTVDPVFQVMPRAIADGPFSVTGEIVYPLPTRPQTLTTGDVMWVDTGINLHGYASDFGATWTIGCEPDDHARVQFARWRDIVDHTLAEIRPGATAADLVKAAGLEHGRRPWLSYFYLAHGCGTDSAEMPFVGTDLGDDFDASLVLQPGMVLVLEPVIWDDGHAGHRSEEIVAVTDTGYASLSERAVLDEAGAV